MAKRLLFAAILLVSLNLPADFFYDEFIDERDGEKYPTIMIGGSEWMARNFNHRVTGSWTYDHNPQYGEEHGRLYTWKAAQKACPKGWHLPSDDEWKALEKTLKIPESQLDEIGYRTPDDGAAYEEFLDAFKLVMSGCRKHETGDFLGLGSFAFFWTSTAHKKLYAWKRAFDIEEPGIGRHTFNRKNGASVRYVKNRGK